jgi:hypothetical protein
VNTVEAGITASNRADREEGRRALPPDEHHLALRTTPRVCAQKGPTARCSSGAPPEPDQTIDLKARPQLTIGSRNRNGLLRRKTTAEQCGCRKGIRLRCRRVMCSLVRHPGNRCKADFL